MLRRSRELFRWARERRRQSDRFAQPRLFHQLQERWEPAMRREETMGEAPPTIKVVAAETPAFRQGRSRAPV